MAILAKQQTPPVALGNPSFEHGFTCCLSWYFNGDIPEKIPTWKEVVDFIMGILAASVSLTT